MLRELKFHGRVTVLVVLADHPLLLSSVVESPVLSSLIGRDVVDLDITGSSKTLEYNGRSQPLEDSVDGTLLRDS